jgi:pimeloyl-ACP methyl ester carboxylesterase
VTKYHALKKFLLYTLAGLFVSGAFVLGISYQVLSELTFARDRVVYGKRQSELAREVRAELLLRPDLTPVSFESTDGVTLAGFFIKRKHAKYNVVICHGYRSLKEFMYGYIDLFPDWNILLFDFRSHGNSDGKITSLGYHESKDVIAAAGYLKNLAKQQQVAHLPTVIFGFSMGGAAALKAAESEPDLADALVIDSTYAQLNSTVLKTYSSKTLLPFYPFFPVITWLFNYFTACDIYQMNPDECVQHIAKPILFIHAARDTFVSSKNVLMLYANIQNKRSKIWIGPPCRHGSLHSLHPQQYHYKVDTFLTKAFAPDEQLAA